MIFAGKITDDGEDFHLDNNVFSSLILQNLFKEKTGGSFHEIDVRYAEYDGDNVPDQAFIDLAGEETCAVIMSPVRNPLGGENWNFDGETERILMALVGKYVAFSIKICDWAD